MNKVNFTLNNAKVEAVVDTIHKDLLCVLWDNNWAILSTNNGLKVLHNGKVKCG